MLLLWVTSWPTLCVWLGMTVVLKPDRDDLLGASISSGSLYGLIFLVAQGLEGLEEESAQISCHLPLVQEQGGAGTWRSNKIVTMRECCHHQALLVAAADHTCSRMPGAPYMHWDGSSWCSLFITVTLNDAYFYEYNKYNSKCVKGGTVDVKQR